MPAKAQTAEEPSGTMELVDPKVLRVCADPANLPFSNDRGEGFENKLAELLARKLNKSLAYVWYPSSTGFFRNTLNAYRCDLVMGLPQGDSIAQTTVPYYRTAYALMFKPESGLAGIETLEDPRLKEKRIGLVAGTPPGNNLAVNGLLTQVKSYPLVVDTRVDSSGAAMARDLVSGDIDVGILWGPMAGYHAGKANLAIAVSPLTRESAGPRLIYSISMAVRRADQDFKRVLNHFVQTSQPEIDAVLLGFGVPLLDQQDHLLADTKLATPQ